MPKTISAANLAMFLTVLSVLADEAQASPGQTTLVIDAFPVQGPMEGLDPEVLDFRYQPGRWQACLGLPDDPYKTIVGSDGGLYYDYGKRGPEPYDNGQGSFGTRVLAELQAEGEPGPCRQSLHSPRIPIVVTECEQGDWLVRQEAWSGVLQGETLEARTPQRVDYLWLTLTNRSRESRTGTVALHVGATSPLNLDATAQTGLAPRLGRAASSASSREPVSRWPRMATSPIRPGPLRVEARSGVSVTRNWARPKVECAPVSGTCWSVSASRWSFASLRPRTRNSAWRWA